MWSYVTQQRANRKYSCIVLHSKGGLNIGTVCFLKVFQNVSLFEAIAKPVCVICLTCNNAYKTYLFIIKPPARGCKKHKIENENHEHYISKYI